MAPSATDNTATTVFNGDDLLRLLKLGHIEVAECVAGLLDDHLLDSREVVTAIDQAPAVVFIYCLRGEIAENSAIKPPIHWIGHHASKLFDAPKKIPVCLLPIDVFSIEGTAPRVPEDTAKRVPEGAFVFVLEDPFQRPILGPMVDVSDAISICMNAFPKAWIYKASINDVLCPIEDHRWSHDETAWLKDPWLVTYRPKERGEKFARFYPTIALAERAFCSEKQPDWQSQAEAQANQMLVSEEACPSNQTGHFGGALHLLEIAMTNGFHRRDYDAMICFALCSCCPAARLVSLISEQTLWLELLERSVTMTPWAYGATFRTRLINGICMVLSMVSRKDLDACFGWRALVLPISSGVEIHDTVISTTFCYCLYKLGVKPARMWIDGLSSVRLRVLFSTFMADDELRQTSLCFYALERFQKADQTWLHNDWGPEERIQTDRNALKLLRVAFTQRRWPGPALDAMQKVEPEELAALATDQDTEGLKACVKSMKTPGWNRSSVVVPLLDAFSKLDFPALVSSLDEIDDRSFCVRRLLEGDRKDLAYRIV